MTLEITVTDSSGNPLPNVEVTIANYATGLVTSRYSDGKGYTNQGVAGAAGELCTLTTNGYSFDTQYYTLTDAPTQQLTVIASLFRQAPSREQVCLGQTTQQGLTITTDQFGEMPWWGGCWAWLTPADRAKAAAQLLAAGDTICLIQVALDGRALYDEPNQFYSVDKFPPLTQTIAQTVDLVAEAIRLGFKAVWLFLDGDSGNYGYPVAVQQSQELGPALGALNAYVQQFPGWDGVFYGYEPPTKITDWGNIARAAGAMYVGVEHSTGHIPLGEGGSDYEPGGCMEPFDTILGEFNDGQFDDTVWQILARMIGPAYVRPSDQPANDDPPPVPFYLQPPSPRGPFYYRIFEYYIYGWVRGTPASVVAASKAYFAKCGGTDIC